MATVTKPLALNESLNTTEQTPRNVADVLSEGLENIKQAIEGGGAGGHEIIDSEGNTMPQEDAMQFADSFVSDDDVNGKTVVENIKEVSPADYDSTTDEGIIVTDDGNDVPIGEIEEDVVSVTADGVKTWAQLLNELYAKIDRSKLNINSTIVTTNLSNVRVFFHISIDSPAINRYLFYTIQDGTEIQFNTLGLKQTDSFRNKYLRTTYTDESSEVEASGYKITLHYGTSSTVINLKTSADYCMMSDGETSVERAINNSGKERTYYGIAINDHEFVVLLSSYEIGRGAPASINVSRIVEAAVGGRNYSSHYFDANGLTIVVASNNLTAGHLIRMTATITW